MSLALGHDCVRGCRSDTLLRHGSPGQVRGGIVLSKAHSQLCLHARCGLLQHPGGRVHARLNGAHPLHPLHSRWRNQRQTCLPSTTSYHVQSRLYALLGLCVLAGLPLEHHPEVCAGSLSLCTPGSLASISLCSMLQQHAACTQISNSCVARGSAPSSRFSIALWLCC